MKYLKIEAHIALPRNGIFINLCYKKTTMSNYVNCILPNLKKFVTFQKLMQ